MVIARMPEDRSKTFKHLKHLQTSSKPYTPTSKLPGLADELGPSPSSAGAARSRLEEEAEGGAKVSPSRLVVVV
eukprot:11772853-Heterocapsa_arctica.AAC.1